MDVQAPRVALVNDRAVHARVNPQLPDAQYAIGRAGSVAGHAAQVLAMPSMQPIVSAARHRQWALPCMDQDEPYERDNVKTLDLDAFRATPLTRDPFEYLIVPGFVKPEARQAVNRDYPTVPDLGSFPLERLKYGEAFKEMVEDLESDEFRKAFEEKFSVDLTGRPSTITARGRCGTRDGFIHTDSTSKIITVLIYMNNSWESQGGRLRLLRSGADLEDMVAEVPPVEGTLVCFRRSDNSWHGHKQFIGDRRVIQFNWVTDKGSQKLVSLRHSLSIPFKKVMSMVRPQRNPTSEPVEVRM
jgi:SM-20-related protein